MGGDLGSIRARLESISEELADLALDRLREAVGGDAGAGADAAAAERRLTRARRAVDKAAALLADRPADDD